MRERLRNNPLVKPAADALAVAADRAERAYGSVPNTIRLLLFAALLIAVPFYENPMGGGVIFDDRWLAVFRLVGLYIILGLGLTVVVGYAGLLDLGYVPFFPSGAYLSALLAAGVAQRNRLSNQ